MFDWVLSTQCTVRALGRRTLFTIVHDNTVAAHCIAPEDRYFSRRMPEGFLNVAGAVTGGMPVASAIWRSGQVWPHCDMKRRWPRIEAPWQGRQDWASHTIAFNNLLRVPASGLRSCQYFTGVQLQGHQANIKKVWWQQSTAVLCIKQGCHLALTSCHCNTRGPEYRGLYTRPGTVILAGHMAQALVSGWWHRRHAAKGLQCAHMCGRKTVMASKVRGGYDKQISHAAR